jgi:hypothetical protein
MRNTPPTTAPIAALTPVERPDDEELLALGSTVVEGDADDNVDA